MTTITPLPRSTFGKALALLRRGRRLVARPNGWTQGRYCRTLSHGEGLAFSYCALGAITDVRLRDDEEGLGSRISGWSPTEAAIEALEEAAGTRMVPEWNDRRARRQEDVVAVYDAAIMAMEAKEAARKAKAEARRR